MPDNFIPLAEVVFEERPVYQNEDGTWRYRLRIPTFLTTYHNWWDWWERCRFKSMEEILRKGDVLLDVGTEVGWISAIYAQFVGAENMCLFEPTPELWPTIKATWEANELPLPMTTSCVFLGDKEENAEKFSYQKSAWPEESQSIQVLTNTKFTHINENGAYRPQTTIDRFLSISGIKPTAITIDVEGAELMVLRGAEKTLRELRPSVWVSIHEDAVTERYQQDPKQIYTLMESCGYDGTYLGFDHEGHWLYRPR